MKEAQITLTYLVTLTENEVGECLTNEEFKARVEKKVNELIDEMGVIIPNDIEIETFNEGKII